MAFTPALAKASSVVTATCPAPKATERASASLEASGYDAVIRGMPPVDCVGLFDGYSNGVPWWFNGN